MKRFIALIVSPVESDRGNNINFIRFIAASLVIYGHMAHFIGCPTPTFCGMEVSSIAVKVFFVLSGYLITQSYLRDGNFPRYLVRRVFRIIPGLIFVCFFSAFILGPALTTLSVKEYFLSSAPYRYFLSNCLLNPVYALPGVFETNVYPNAVNGSLWTLPVEFSMYLVLPICLGLLGRTRKVRWIIPSLAVLTGAVELVHIACFPEWSFVLWGTDWFQALALIPYFFIGSTFVLFKLDPHANIQVAFLFVFVLAIANIGPRWQLELASYFILSYATIACSFAAPAFFGRVFAENDYSYGIYLWAFPVQQTLAMLCGWGADCLYASTCISFVVTFACAMVSWHLVEKPASAAGKRITKKLRARQNARNSSEHEGASPH